MPAAVLPPMLCVAYSEMNVLSPMKTIERQITASDSFTKDALSSDPAGAAVPDPPTFRRPSACSTGRHTATPASAGNTSSGVSRNPPGPTTAATMSGAVAKPKLPPTENQAIALWLPPLAIRATRADSG